mmetsp:Transcript_28561/g.32010  ORF Transcript_28561/g.32010 Transcript_28561/m.32010 type:complete len:461 (+) Transcript_28561:265-1647(+)
MAASCSETSSSTTTIVNTSGASSGSRSSMNNYNSAATTTTMVAGLMFTGASKNYTGHHTRIRTPLPQDVISGRGGPINLHPGNKIFRKWVRLRKEDYNLARNKKEKTVVAMEVVRQVKQQKPCGRFLTKDPSVIGGNDGHWWVQIDEVKALAKTTQALREGAPKIRMAHQDPESVTSAATATTSEREKTTSKKRKRKKSSSLLSSPVSVPEQTKKANTTEAKQTITNEKMEQHDDVTLPPISLPSYKSEQMLLPTTDYTIALEKLQENAEKAKYLANKQEVREPEEKQQNQQEPIQQMHNEVQQHHPVRFLAPLPSNKVFGTNYRKGFNPLIMSAVDPFAETPPLMPAPEPDFGNEIPTLRLAGNDNNSSSSSNSLPQPLPRRTKMHRVHSLALSDYDGSADMNLIMGSSEVEFVNPFADESNVLASENDSNIVMSHVPSFVTKQWGVEVAAGREKTSGL